MLEFISKLSFSKGIDIVFILFGAIVAPYWFIFQFAHDIYKGNSLIQLLLLSGCISVPIILFTFLILSAIKQPNAETELDRHYFSLLGTASLFVALCFYSPSFYQFIKDEHLPLRGAIYISFMGGFFALCSQFGAKLAKLLLYKKDKSVKKKTIK